MLFFGFIRSPLESPIEAFWLRVQFGLLVPWAAKEVTPLAAAHLLKFLGWARPRVIPSELTHGHPELHSHLKKRLDPVLVLRSPNPDDRNQTTADISFITLILYMHQISEAMIHCWLLGWPLVCSYFILLANITSLWRNTASITIS